ncbi:MAG: formate dehydrogenase subunit delta [Xanthobacteraceae bacterium]
MSLDTKLVYMANQIGKFFASQGPDRAVAGTAEHIKKFWDPRMRAAILAHLEKGGAGLDPAVREALASLGGKDAEAKLKTLTQN